MQPDFSAVTDAVIYFSKHPRVLYAVVSACFLPLARPLLRTEKLKSGIRSLGAVYIEFCSTGEKCVKSTRRLISCFRSETTNQSQQNGILASRISDREPSSEQREHNRGTESGDFKIATSAGATGR
jgi:hypothetical protein